MNMPRLLRYFELWDVPCPPAHREPLWRSCSASGRVTMTILAAPPVLLPAPKAPKG